MTEEEGKEEGQRAKVCSTRDRGDGGSGDDILGTWCPDTDGVVCVCSFQRTLQTISELRKTIPKAVVPIS